MANVKGAPVAGTTGVFVDDAGRRSRWIARAGRLVGAGCIIYIVVIVASLFGATWVPRVSLPGVGRVVPSSRPVASLVLPPTAAHTPFPTRTSATGGSPAPVVAPTSPSASSPAAGVATTISPSTTSAPGHSGSVPGHATTTAAPTTSPTSSPTGATAPPTTADHGHSTTAPGHTKKGG